MTTYSHSRVECFNFCQYKYKLQYVDKLDVLFDGEPSNPLVIGSAMHLGIERGIDECEVFYKSYYPLLTDSHYNELIKFEELIPKIEKVINRNNCKFEEEIKTDDFIGYIDIIECNDDETVNIYDFKYSNEIDKYLKSPQIHLYKYYFEQLHQGLKVNKMGYIFIPKITIKQKKTEILAQFRIRLVSELRKSEVKKIEVDYNPLLVEEFKKNIKKIENTKDYEKCDDDNICRFCGFNSFCKKGFTYDLVHKN